MTDPASPQFPVDVDRVRRHYDRLSFLYRMFWGEHLHHGYWEGGETVARAQVQLMERLAQMAGIARGVKVLDIGCGVGGSALWLASEFGCDVTGMTISPVQAAMATRKAKARGLAAKLCFEVKDANQWIPQPETFDVIWIVESSEHFPNKKNFIKRCAAALKPEGTLAVCAWLRREGAMQPGEEEMVAAIAEAMMSASLDSLGAYRRWMIDAGLTVTAAEDITSNVAPTWDHCGRLGENPVLKFLVRFADAPTRRFVKAFPLMRRAYASRAMAFGLFVARKPASAKAY
ncbi:MAG: class I SAM-dependent methyltransferase [Bryobacteraceae bacterium]